MTEIINIIGEEEISMPFCYIREKKVYINRNQIKRISKNCSEMLHKTALSRYISKNKTKSITNDLQDKLQNLENDYEKIKSIMLFHYIELYQNVIIECKMHPSVRCKIISSENIIKKRDVI